LRIGEAAGDKAISPQVGEMSGRTEGGAVERGLTSPGCWVWALDMKKKVGYAPDI